MRCFGGRLGCVCTTTSRTVCVDCLKYVSLLKEKLITHVFSPWLAFSLHAAYSPYFSLRLHHHRHSIHPSLAPHRLSRPLVSFPLVSFVLVFPLFLFHPLVSSLLVFPLLVSSLAVFPLFLSHQPVSSLLIFCLLVFSLLVSFLLVFPLFDFHLLVSSLLVSPVPTRSHSHA